MIKIVFFKYNSRIFSRDLEDLMQILLLNTATILSLRLSEYKQETPDFTLLLLKNVST